MVSRGQNQDSYFSRLHLVGVVTLSVLTIGLGLAGWALRPSSSGFSAVPTNLALYVTKAPPALAFTETMEPSGDGGAVLTLAVTLGITDVPQEGAFNLVVDNLGDGTLCTPSRLSVYDGEPPVRVPPQHLFEHAKLSFHGHLYTLGRGHTLTGISGTGPFQVHLCWPSDGPVTLNGAYFSARFPAVNLDGSMPDVQSVTRQLNLGSADESSADYAVQSLQQPTSVTQGGWQWAPRLSLAPGALPVPLTFSAVDSSETQHDTYDAFLSGIVFGIAGGALVSLVQELVAPFRSRRDLRPPEPVG